MTRWPIATSQIDTGSPLLGPIEGVCSFGRLGVFDYVHEYAVHYAFEPSLVTYLSAEVI